MPDNPKFTGDENIFEILNQLPEAREILISHGLHCAGCHVGAYETLRQGAFAHGFSEKELQTILDDLNAQAQESGTNTRKKKSAPPELTDFAVKKIKEFQKEQHKENSGFKIDVIQSGGENSYFLDLLDSPETNDKIIESKGVKMFISPKSLSLIENCTIDFVETDTESGFKIEKR